MKTRSVEIEALRQRAERAEKAYAEMRVDVKSLVDELKRIKDVVSEQDAECIDAVLSDTNGLD